MSKEILIKALNYYRVEINFEDNKYSQADRKLLISQINDCEKDIEQATDVEEIFSSKNLSILYKAIECAIKSFSQEHDAENKKILKELKMYLNYLKKKTEV